MHTQMHTFKVFNRGEKIPTKIIFLCIGECVLIQGLPFIRLLHGQYALICVCHAILQISWCLHIQQ